ncbi:hypothetical protein [Aliikangiella sp. IMCC44359]|uniref:hypothetical protein n=1 Tax=Aliikangiella sp. IMCC44359 TaxID=3459125 RepID=UPI00403B16A6
MQQTITNNSFFKILILISSSFTFAYCLGVGVHELGHVLAYQYHGISTKTFVLDPFGHSYMVPEIDYAEGELLQRSGGSLFNIFCALLVSSVFWKKKNLFAFPLLMWPATALIQESVAIILDIINGMTFDWAFVASEGVPVYAIIGLSIVFLILGCSIFLSLLSIAGLKPSDSISQIIATCLISVTPFFIISLIYAMFFLVSDKDNWVLSKSIALAASIVLSMIIAFLFKPTYPFLNRFIIPISNQIVENKQVVSSMIITLLFIAFCSFFYN